MSTNKKGGATPAIENNTRPEPQPFERRIIKFQPRPTGPFDWAPKEIQAGLIPVPSDQIPYALSAKHVFKALVDSGRFVHDGKQPLELRGGKYITLTPERLCSELDKLGTVVRYLKNHECDEILWGHTRLSLDDARILLETNEAKELLPGV